MQYYFIRDRKSKSLHCQLILHAHTGMLVFVVAV